jgi:pantoate--beta-alanine ligase
MIIFKKADDLTRWLGKQRATGQNIGFVPTMGALHEGHISLIDISKKNAAVTVCSIFVNPTQFNDPRDFQKYPVTLEKDIALLEGAGVDVLFLPSASTLYPGGTSGLEHYELGRLETILEGKYRPGHFQGVCQVMRRLLDLVGPDQLFMGQKDYQQCMVIRRLLELMGTPVLLHRCPIVREPDGLAMSSRNMRLTPAERVNATAIFRALQSIKDGWGPPPDPLRPSDPGVSPISVGPATAKASALLESANFRVDYISIADATTLEPLSSWQENAIALIAAFQGEVRLIDNMLI